ncbi:RYamide neuropeptides [Uranotaenia lowii]|uniref:RYamide neuropeptides n=1 Tax=Uranotaenia lowii TaxID=190385 RepID=UPI002478CD7A|nr:RYamide neuropeptides [Uranotaenia lowii]XP_055607681.1 RYamide neuropeptides [Uranotaenia lowii]
MKLIAANRRSRPAASIYATVSMLAMFGCMMLMLLVHVCDADPALETNGLYGGDDKHSNDKRPFFVGSRYGRSHVYGKDLRQVNVVPRNDRFFLGSRYGKRADPLNKEIETDNNNGAELTYLACLHTGVSNLYRCYGKERDFSLSGQTIQQMSDSLDSPDQ